ncbi:MAG: DUF3631 domain-containing protein, partial [Candidatus Limnocylindrales bacterium]
LWAAHTHRIDAADITPYLAILSVEKRSGKTRLFDILELVVSGPWRPIEPSDAVVYSLIDQRHPTLLLDEADALFGSRLAAAQHEALRAILNASNRRGGTVPRLEMLGRERRVVEFDAFCPKAFAGIGSLPDTLEDRSIVIHLRRRARTEQVSRYRRREAEPEGELIKTGLSSAMAAADLAGRHPEIPLELDDRAADGWEPLLAIADVAGAAWTARARAAALALSGDRRASDESLGGRLLADICEVFAAWPARAMASAELVRQLCAREESPWGDLSGHLLTTQGLARRL